MSNKTEQSQTKNNRRISVIIPIFDAEKYIDRCVKSVLCQTYCDFEIILIDDGSRDKSGEIIEELKDKDERILVFHKVNEGVAEARNFGIEKASGNYICFVDSDDWVQPTYLEDMLKALETKNADVCVSNYCTVNKGIKSINDSKKIGDNEKLEALLKDNEYAGYCWNKLYKKQAISNISFAEGVKIHEDLLFNLEVWGNINKVAYVKKPLYNYVIRKESTLHSDRSFERFSAIKGIYEILEARGSKYENDYKLYYLLEYYKKKALQESEDDRNIKEEAKTLFRPSIFLKHGSIAKKIKLIMTALFPKVYYSYDKNRYGKKCTIYTLPGYFNYGNRLQLFALSKILTRLGATVRVFQKNNRATAIKEFIKFNTPLRRKYAKETKLKVFTKKNIAKTTKRQYGNCSIVGSDQVWNPNYLQRYPYLLNPAKEARQVSYAASMGVCELDKNQSDAFRDALNSYSTITVREKTALDVLQPLTDKKIRVVLDPTLLLDKTEYEQLEKRPKDIAANEEYLLCYILGNKDYQAAIEEYASKRKLKIIFFSDRRDSSYGIEEFLYLIHHAKLICTDSFHACVFSIIFERPFVAFRRTGKENYMYTRLQYLIETFKLRDREYNGKNIVENNIKVDYSEAKKILEKEQKRSIELLRKVLN